MLTRRYIFIVNCLFFVTFLSGQCPDRNVLWKRIIYLRDSSQADVSGKLKELLQFENEIQNCPDKYDSTYAYLLQRIGVMYFRQSDYLQAVQYTRKSIDIIKANEKQPNINPLRLIDCYVNLMYYYDSLKLVAKKNEIVDSCTLLALTMKAIDGRVITAMENKAQYLFNTGDYQGCISYTSMGEAVAKNYHQEDMNLFIWHFDALLFSKEYGTAEQILKSRMSQYLKLKDDEYLGTMYMLSAELANQKEDVSEALFYYNKALQSNLRIGFMEGYSKTLDNIGFYLYFGKLHQYDKALSFYWKALRYADARESLNILANIANVYVKKKKFDSAHYFFQKAFDKIRPGINEKDLLEHTQEYVTGNITEYVISLVLDKADASLYQFKTTSEKQALSTAINVYTTADKLLERIKLTQNETQSKLFWRRHARRLYEHAIEACYLQDNFTDAFYFFEKSRAVLLNDQLNEQQLLNEEDLIKQTLLRKKILQLQRELAGTDKSSTHYAALQNELLTGNQESEHLQDLIKVKYPFYYQNFIDKNFISINDVRQIVLKDRQALVELFAGDSTVYVLAITGQNFFLQKIDKTLFDELSDEYRSYISNQDLLNKNSIAFKNLSRELYQLIFHNIDLPGGRIIISPDGKYFPFEALVTRIQPLTYFLEDHAVSYTYSARYLLNNFTTNSNPGSNTFMGIAPVQFVTGLPPLMGSDESLRRMESYFSNPTNLVGNKATKNNFLDNYYKYKIIQLYTHATDSGYAGEPMIYFSDSLLSLSDLFYENRPATNLIVLSACETASGKLYNGEGVFSFNRGFAALGIPSSISNLWQVDNQSTYRLTELFYKYMSDGLPLDIALQKAKKEFIKTITPGENKLPYYWAASILIGKTDTITLQKKFEWKWIGGIALLILLGLIGRIIVNKRKYK